MSRPTRIIAAAADFLAYDDDPVDFVSGDGSRPPLLRRRNSPTEVLELRGASEAELYAIESGMVMLQNEFVALQARPSTR
jgi:hypothetical protein